MSIISKTTKQGFTLIELLVVIVIIGILATLTTVALTSARGKARDARRISDLKQIASALELYYADNNSYPTIITPGNALTDPNNTKTYMAKVPSNPTPRAEGPCADLEYQYGGSVNNYSLIGCLAKDVGEASAGARRLEAGGVARDIGATDGLVAWWMLDGNFGHRDVTGNNLTSYSQGAVNLSSGRYGEANGSYFFTGSSNSVPISTNAADCPLHGATNMSICAWFKRDTGNYVNSAAIVANYKNDSISQNYFMVETPENTIIFYTGNGVTGVYASPSATLIPNTWNFVCGIFKGAGGVAGAGRTYLSINGGSIGTGGSHSLNNIGSGTTVNCYIGRYTNSAIYFKGNIADVRYYNKALTQADVNLLYATTKP